MLTDRGTYLQSISATFKVLDADHLSDSKWHTTCTCQLHYHYHQLFKILKRLVVLNDL